MRQALFLSPVGIPPYRKEDERHTYDRSEEVWVELNRAVLLPNFPQVYRSTDPVAAINAEIAPYKLAAMEKVVIFIQFGKRDAGIIRPIASYLKPEKVIWVLCSRSKDVREVIEQAGHKKALIPQAPDCSGAYLGEMVRNFHGEPERVPTSRR